MSKSLEERFWEKVDKSGGPDACWPWTAYMRDCGSQHYGNFSYGGRTVLAHRMAYELATGTRIMPGLDVCHSCDFGLCCNPAHLSTGTRSDNLWDASRKGRLSGRHSHRVSEYTVRLIHVLGRLGASRLEIANQVGTSLSYTSELLSGKYRRDVWEEFNGCQSEYQSIGA